MSVKEKIEILTKCRVDPKVSLTFCLKALSIPRSSYYRTLKTPSLDPYTKHQGLRRQIERIIIRHPGYGYRRIKQD